VQEQPFTSVHVGAGVKNSTSTVENICPYPPVDVSRVTVHEIRQPEGARIACPRELLVEKRLQRSMVISWSPPEHTLTPVTQYHVCVDGAVKAVVPGGYKTKVRLGGAQRCLLFGYFWRFIRFFLQTKIV